MSSSDLENRLRLARARMELISASAVSSFSATKLQELRSAQEDVLELERELAKDNGQPYLLSLNLPIQWHYGAPLPHFVQSEHKAFLCFFLNTFEPSDARDFEGVSIQSISAKEKPVGVIEFTNYCAGKMVRMSADYLNQHELYGRGLHPYSAQEVVNSEWLAELQRIAKIPAQHHFIFFFHDSIFECVASALKVHDYHQTSLEDVLLKLCCRLE